MALGYFLYVPSVVWFSLCYQQLDPISLLSLYCLQDDNLSITFIHKVLQDLSRLCQPLRASWSWNHHRWNNSWIYFKTDLFNLILNKMPTDVCKYNDHLVCVLHIYETGTWRVHSYLARPRCYSPYWTLSLKDCLSGNIIYLTAFVLNDILMCPLKHKPAFFSMDLAARKYIIQWWCCSLIHMALTIFWTKQSPMPCC